MASSGAVFSSPDEVQKWYDAVQLYDAGEMQQSAEKFAQVMQCSKMKFNIGCCYLTMNEVDLATQNYDAAIAIDSHNGISYFMNGLIYFLKNEFNTSFEYFEKSRTTLRGNTHIDYSQLGLSYKLYACEILTNQASIMCKQSNIGKARELLLLASSWKVEKRHDIISDSLDMLQAGSYCSMSIFTLPKDVIFRPSNKIVSQLKKKDYLGKAKVLATRNTDEIYACFSGLKAKLDVEVPNHVPEKTVKTVLTDIKRKESKEKLKRIPPRKNLPEFQLGRVIQGSPKLFPRKIPNSTDALQNDMVSKGDLVCPPPPRRPPLPNSRSVDDISISSEKRQSGVFGKQLPPFPPPTKTPPLLNHVVDFDTRRTSSCPASELLEKRKVRPPIPKLSDRHTMDDGSNQSKLVPPPKPKRSNGHCDNHCGEDDGNPPTELLEKWKVPLPLPRKSISLSDESNCNPSNELSEKFKSPLPTPRKSNGHCEDDVLSKWQNKTPGKKVHEVEISYTFTHKVKLKEGLSLREVQSIVEAQPVPDNIQMCTTDKNGKVQLLTEEMLEQFLQSNSSKKEIFCTTHDTRT